MGEVGGDGVQWARAAVTGHHGLDQQLRMQTWMLTGLRLQVLHGGPARQVGEDSLPGLHVATFLLCPHMPGREGRLPSQTRPTV